MPDTSKHIWRTPKTAQSPYRCDLWSDKQVKQGQIR